MKRKKATVGRPSVKAAFVRKHLSKSDKEILELSRRSRSGVALTLEYIACVRKRVRAKTAKMARVFDPNFNKSEFIRKHPGKTALQVVTAAADIGQTISEGIVWSVRSANRKKSKSTKTPVVSNNETRTKTKILIDLMVDVGLIRVKELVQRLEAIASPN